MSIFIQEVLNLLKRKKVKETLDLQYDYFEFGKKVKSTLNPAYGPKMEPFAIKSQDFVCTVTEGLTKTAVGSGATGIIPVYTSPSGFCLTKTLENSIITQTFDAFFNDKQIALIDPSKKNVNDKTWSFWEKEPSQWNHIIQKHWKQAAVLN